MTNSVAICSLALAQLGQAPITSLLDPETAQEQLCAQHYDIARRALLSDSEWSFATFRFVSSQVNNPPEPNEHWGFGYVHALPGDTLRVLEVRRNPRQDTRNETQWQVEGNNIITDADTIYVRAIKDITDASRFTPQFITALVPRLAAELCIPITQNMELHASLSALALAKRNEAANVDSMQGRTRALRATNLTTRR